MTTFMAVMSGWVAASIAFGLVVAGMIRQEECLVRHPTSSESPDGTAPARVVDAAGPSGSAHQEAVPVR